MADTKGHLVFAAGESLFGVPAEHAQEVVTLPVLTRVPGAPAHLLGVFAHRGEVIPVIDLSKLIGHESGSSRRAVLMRGQKGTLAFTASRVNGVSTLQGQLDRLGDTGVRAHLRGPAKGTMGEVAVIDPEGIFQFLSHGG
jgi:purine-binding chemotaxis protein CheW